MNHDNVYVINQNNPATVRGFSFKGAEMKNAAGIIADRLERTRAEIEAIDSLIKSAGLYSEADTERAALLLLTVLAGASRETAAITAYNLAGLRDAYGTPAPSFVGNMIQSVISADGLEKVAFASTISVIDGDYLNVVVAVFSDEGTDYVHFSHDGKFMPHRDLSVSSALTLPGRILYRIARDLAPPFAFLGTVDGLPIANWKAGIEAELAKMPVNL